ncbi:DNA gyrase subunit A [Leptospira jelokensis]|uniref:DNA gyrase subunit A n=1 Tax=Leptospira jelokensis TaxID=2484931 RepID=A0A4Z0ZZ17_9LEPT|nr:DNA gyrase subunit A [Leptospira jelokensis]TGL65465.1 DNA gyrase subunit A [Leptospira jelokensis]TGM02041.1 DNA gyrase subunit A [Leptospira jelokensis]
MTEQNGQENESNKTLALNLSGRPDVAGALKAGVRVIPVEIEDQMKEAYLDYAMSVIVGRALPDVRDGLKPVHRRVLHAMNERAWRSDRPYVKSAKIVGEVIGNYHPHGDSAVYETMVRMAQTFSMRETLIDGQGNFGSVDGDNAAAYRYTEARLTKLAEELLKDIEKNTVSFSPNFDDTRQQPDVLPANFPNILVNGSTGIAVGMATNIPPHNLKEAVNAVIAMIQNPEITLPELMKILPGPDFPTGGIIIGGEGLYQAYATGKGSIRIRSKVEIIENNKGREIIVIHEIPYQVNKKNLLEKIGDLVNEKLIEGISEILDLSDRKGIRVEIHVKKDANAQVILNQLFKLTQLQVSYGITMLAILDNRPKIFSLKEILKSYAEHRREVVVKRTEFDLDKAQKRAHILEGLRIALENIDEVIRIIRASKDVKEAQSSLMATFALSELQADAILEMRLQRLTSLEVQKIIDELEQVRLLIADLEDILAKPERVKSIICDELGKVSQSFGNTRTTEISLESLESSTFNAEDLIADEEVVVQLSEDMFIKRLPMDTFRRQKRGGKGVQGISTKREDFVKKLSSAMTHDNLMLFSNKGRAFLMKVYELPIATKEARGKSLKAVINLNDDEIITSLFTFRNFDDSYLLMVTKEGFVKKIQLDEFTNTKKSGIIAIGLRDGDELIDVIANPNNYDVFIGSKNGLAIRMNLNELRSQGRTASGVTAMKLEDDDAIAGITKVEPNTYLFCISENGFGKRTDFEEFSTKGRGGKGMTYLKIGEKNGRAVGISSVKEEDELLVITQSGMAIRVEVKTISMVGRSAMGVKVVNTKDEDFVKDFAVVRESDSDQVES